MNRYVSTLFAAALFALPAGGASAAIFDFAAMADAYKSASSSPNNQEATYDQMVAFNSAFFTDGGISIIDISSEGPGSHPFFDGGQAGLGVCSSGIGDGTPGISNCSSGGGTGQPAISDDNVTAGESVKLTFDQVVSVTELFFRGSNHGTLTGSLNINGNGYSVTNGLLDSFAGLGSGTMFEFEFTGDEFYLSTAAVSAVPIPASILLFGTALGGLGLLRRRRKTA